MELHMLHFTDQRLSLLACLSGLLGIPLWLYANVWLPLTMPTQGLAHTTEFIRLGELGALCAGLTSVGLGLVAIRQLEPGSLWHQRATQGFVLGIITLAFIIGVDTLAWF
jgi:hypothetical protein